MIQPHLKMSSSLKILTSSWWHQGTLLVSTSRQYQGWKGSPGELSIALLCGKDETLLKMAIA